MPSLCQSGFGCETSIPFFSAIVTAQRDGYFPAIVTTERDGYFDSATVVSQPTLTTPGGGEVYVSMPMVDLPLVSYDQSLFVHQLPACKSR